MSLQKPAEWFASFFFKLSRAGPAKRVASASGTRIVTCQLIQIDANQALVGARSVVHAVSLDALREETDEGRSLAEEARQMGIMALQERQFRRKGLRGLRFFSSCWSWPASISKSAKSNRLRSPEALRMPYHPTTRCSHSNEWARPAKTRAVWAEAGRYSSCQGFPFE
jgi:hypothetical protein